MDMLIRISNGVMFIRILGPQLNASCVGGHDCPAILEMEGGDYAIIGIDITTEARARLPVGSGCGQTERVVRVPRQILVQARADIPAA